MILNKVMALNFIKAAMITLLIFSYMPSSKADEVSTLIQKLKGKDPFARRDAAEALVKIGTPAVEPLIAALKDKDPRIRVGAAVALGKIGDARAVEPLIAALKDEYRYVQEEATEALGEIGAPAVELLIVALKDGNSGVREGAAKALGKIKDPRAVEAVSDWREKLLIREEHSAAHSIGPSETSPPNRSKIVEDELKNLSLGQVLFNPPQEMQVGIKERVEVSISKTIKEDLSKGLRGRGIPQIEEIEVGTFMTVRLRGDNFDIKTISNEEQLVAGEGFTQWEWDVTPLGSGNHSLLLTVTVRIKLSEGDEEKKDYPVFERQIKVKVNPVYTTIQFAKRHWMWIITTISGSGIIGWLIKKWRKSKKK